MSFLRIELRTFCLQDRCSTSEPKGLSLFFEKLSNEWFRSTDFLVSPAEVMSQAQSLFATLLTSLSYVISLGFERSSLLLVLQKTPVER